MLGDFLYTWEIYSDAYDRMLSVNLCKEFNEFLEENFGDLWLVVRSRTPKEVVRTLNEITGVSVFIKIGISLVEYKEKLEKIKMIRDF